jgi:predicted lipopolysaccharide heptosyltransferase III
MVFESINMKRILLIRFGSLGDVVLTTPAIRAVREKFPNAYIAMVVGDRSADIVSANPRLNEVIVFHRERKGLSEIKRVAAMLRERSFDVSIDMQRKFRSSLLAYLSRTEFRVGYHQPGGFLCSVKIPNSENKHAIDRNLDLLKPLDIGSGLKTDRAPEMFLSRKDRDYAWDIFQERGLASRSLVVGMFPGAGWHHRCWPAERFAAIGDLAAERYNAGVVVFGGPGEADIVKNVAQKMTTTPVLIKNRMTLRQLGALIEKCDLFLSNDTGPMHISVAVKTTTIGLFGPGNHIKFRPIGERHALVRHDMPCSPCKQFTDRCKDNVCMRSITVEEVWEAVRERLGT